MTSPYDPAARSSADTALTGHVSSAGRTPADVTVTLTDHVGVQVTRARTGADGGFRLTGLAPGTYVAIFSRAGYHPHAVTIAVPSTAPLEVTLEPNTAVHGIVHDRHTGQPVAAALVTAVGLDGEVVASTVSDPDGGYRLTGVDTAELTLVAAAPTADPVALRVDVAGPDHRVDLPVDLHSRLTGTVTAGGRPVAGLGLTLRDEQSRTVSTAVTDETGTYRFERIGAGTYTLHSATSLPQVTAITPGAATVDLTLPPAF
jgi:hypothetical protein